MDHYIIKPLQRSHHLEYTKYGIYGLTRGVGFLIAFTLVCTMPIHASVITVCSGGCDFTSIQEAINMANHGDIIQIGPETYQENLNVNPTLPF